MSIILGVVGYMLYASFMSETAHFWEAKKKAELTQGPCNMEYVGKQELDPTAQAIPLKPPVGPDYILFKQKCNDTDK